MFINTGRCPCLFRFAALLCAPAASAQQQKPLTLDVVVTAKSGLPVSDLQRQDFTLLDNKVPQTITSFQAVDGSGLPLRSFSLSTG